MSLFCQSVNWLNQSKWMPVVCPFTGVVINKSEGNSRTLSGPNFGHGGTVSSIVNRETMKTLSLSGFSVSFYNSIKAMSTVWESATDSENIFLQKTYLEVLEENPPENMRFCYLIFHKDNQAIGVASCQILKFNAKENISAEENKEEKKPYFKAVKNKIKNFVTSRLEFNLMACGNMLLTGDHGFYFDEKKVSKMEAFKLIEEGLNYAQICLDKQNIKVHGTMLKDFTKAQSPDLTQLSKGNRRFNELMFQPNMLLDIRKNWTSFDDYLQAMSSKYRVRAKRAFKKAKNIEKRELDVDEIKSYKNRINDLYQNIAGGADFNMVELHPDYFLALKKAFLDQYKLTGYFIDDQMVAFYTTIQNGHELEAHFLGFDHSVNRATQAYMNILYDIIRRGIETGSERVVFARTALEIKSSVGAVAEEMFCYLRHNAHLPNRFMTFMVEYLQPNVEWVPRHPFKEEEV